MMPALASAQDEGFQVTTTDIGVVVGVGGRGGSTGSVGRRFEKAFKELPNLANYWKPGLTLYADAGSGYGAIHGGIVFKLSE